MTEVTDLRNGFVAIDVVIEGGGEPEATTFSMVNGRDATASEARIAGVAVGKVYVYEVRNILEGHCTPHITQVLLEPWSGRGPEPGPP
ncbi:hypothetical protein L6R50_24970 [Myxococcota bacterium]|nr:hypothetical protein [Myxococcota bacterium]